MTDLLLHPEASPADLRLRESAQRRIGGWLLFFWFTIMIGSPIVLIRAALKTHSIGWIALYLGLISLNVILGVLILVRSQITFIALWLKAVEVLVRSARLVWIGHRLSTHGFTQGLLTEVNAVTNASIIIIWLIYFHRSRRVLYTFGKNL